MKHTCSHDRTTPGLALWVSSDMSQLCKRAVCWDGQPTPKKARLDVVQPWEAVHNVATLSSATKCGSFDSFRSDSRRAGTHGGTSSPASTAYFDRSQNFIAKQCEAPQYCNGFSKAASKRMLFPEAAAPCVVESFLNKAEAQVRHACLILSEVPLVKQPGRMLITVCTDLTTC